MCQTVAPQFHHLKAFDANTAQSLIPLPPALGVVIESPLLIIGWVRTNSVEFQSENLHIIASNGLPGAYYIMQRRLLLEFQSPSPRSDRGGSRSNFVVHDNRHILLYRHILLCAVRSLQWERFGLKRSPSPIPNSFLLPVAIWHKCR